MRKNVRDLSYSKGKTTEDVVPPVVKKKTVKKKTVAKRKPKSK